MNVDTLHVLLRSIGRRGGQRIERIAGRAPEIGYSTYKIAGGKLVVPETPGFGLKLV